MEQLSLETKRIIWSSITSDEDLKSCALVNWEWYSQYFGREAIGVPKRLNPPKRWVTGGGYKPFMSEMLCGTEAGLDQALNSITHLINEFQEDKTEWYNKAYTPYIMELNLHYLEIDLKESGLRFTGLKTIAGGAKQLLAMLTTDVVQPEQLRNLSVRVDSQSVLDNVVDKLFNKLGELNIDRFKIKMCSDRSPKIQIEVTEAVTKFLGQLTQLDITSVFFGAEIFQYLPKLETFSMQDVARNCKDYDGPGAERNDVFVAHEYFAEMTENLNNCRAKLKSVTFVDEEVVLRGLTSSGLELIAGSLEHLVVMDSFPENRPYNNVFTLNIDGIRDFNPFSGLNKVEGLSIHDESTLTKLGLACRQLEEIKVQIKVDFSNITEDTVLFPNLVRSNERVASTSRSKCICSFVKKHMPAAKFYGYGILCGHCLALQGGNVNSGSTWTDFVGKDCPNLKDIQIDLYLPAYGHFEECTE